MAAPRHRAPPADIVETFGPFAWRFSLERELSGEAGDTGRHRHVVLRPDPDPVPPVVEVVAHRAGDRPRYPEERHHGQEPVPGERPLDVARGVGPGPPLLQDPGGEAGGRIVQRISEGLGLGRLDRAVASLLVVPSLTPR